MNEKIYTITLEDGTQITNLRMNGNNFVSQNPINPEIFEGKLGEVIISDGATNERHTNMELVQIMPFEGEYYFVLIDIPESQLKERKLRSDVDYIAMMSDIDI